MIAELNSTIETLEAEVVRQAKVIRDSLENEKKLNREIIRLETENKYMRDLLNCEEYYVIYGLNNDFTYLEKFDDELSMKSFIENYIKERYGYDYKIIKGNEINYE